MKNQLFIPHRFEIIMQNLEKNYLELETLGYVNTIEQARTMVTIFREAFAKENKKATVFFKHVNE